MRTLVPGQVMSEPKYRKITEESDVDSEVLAAAEYAESWFTDDRIDWDDFIDKMDGYHLKDGSVIDMGPSMDTPAIRAIKRYIKKLRAQG